MIVSYRHEDGTLEEVTTDDLSAMEAAAIEGVTGQEWSDVEGALRGQSPTAMRAVLWAFRKRQQPTLRFKDFDVPGWRRRLKATVERPEIEDLMETLLRDAENGEQIEEMAHYIRKFAHDPEDVDRVLAEQGPKAPGLPPAASREESAASSTTTGA